ncbi:hypothetical protein MA16_Dca017534 [Dendrobium catenatum]|uniref:Uncharacterized protein n=1 Tax=Dendrobium catenatum TaxID=906689 RepID=A0A2I0W1W7_9ASPA|nr:hypothetical protein MA16_Dca017534 [Dendrobium catenatum]
MCQGQNLRNDLRRPASTLTITPVTARLAVTNVELAAARARLVESMAQLERERARAAELRRRLAESYAERDRLRKLASVMDIIRYRLASKKLRLEATYSRNYLPAKQEGTISIGLSEAGDLCTSRRSAILDS